MKAFFLRELAFLVAPVMLFTRPKVLMSRFISIMVAAVFIFVLMSTLTVFALQPVGWAWLGVAVGLGLSAILLLVAVSFGV